MKSFLLMVLVTFLVVSAEKPNDENNPYEFGFTIDGQQHRHEKKDVNGIIQGEFGFITADGIYHVTVYATDENGNFRILSMRNLRVSAPLDGSPLPPGAKIEGNATQGAAPPQHQKPIETTTTQRSGAPFAFTTQPTIKPACGGCGYVTTPKPKPGQPFPFQTPDFQKPAQQQNYQQNTQAQQAEYPGQQQNNYQQNQQENSQEQNYQQQQNNNQQNSQEQQNYQQNTQGQQSAYPGQQQNNQEQNYQQQQNNNQQNSQEQQNYQQNTQGQQSAYPGQQQNNQEQNYQQQQNNNQQNSQEQQNYQQQQQNNQGQQPAYQGQQQSYQEQQNYQQQQQQSYQEQQNYQQQQQPEPPAYPGQQANNQQQNAVGHGGLSQVSVGDGVIHVPGSADIPIKDKYPGMVDGLPSGVDEKDISDLLYKFNYTVGFHGHYEKGYKNGAKVGGYFVTDRDGLSRVVTYVADENGFRPKVKLVRLDLASDEVPKEGSEKTFGLKHFEFVWYPVS